MKKYNLILMALFLSVGFVSCSDDDDSIDKPEPQTAQMSVSLIDAPGDYEKVFINVVDVMVKVKSEENPVEGWQSLDDVNEGVYDLLTLTGGESVLLAEAELPPGQLTEMRLVLGSENNSIVINEIPYTLKIPSGEESGLKLKVDKNLVAGEEYNFVLDFNVAESVVETENGGYNLKPVVRLFLESETGTISGAITPKNVHTLVKASNETLTVSTYTNPDGKFLLQGLPAGEYKVEIIPDPTLEYPVSTFNNVTVEVGKNTKLNTVNLN